MLTRISEIRSLSPETADQGLPVRISGVVTGCTQYEIFVQNGEEAVFVAPPPDRPPYRPGDYVEFHGKTSAGHFLPLVLAEGSRLLGRRPLPTPFLASYETLATGELDCRYVEIVGVIRTATLTELNELKCKLAIGGSVLRLDVATSPNPRTDLIGATVRIRGIGSGVKNQKRQIIQPMVWVPADPAFIEVIHEGPQDFFSLEAQAISTLRSSTERGEAAPLSKVAGQILWAESDTRVYVRDSTDSIEVLLQRPTGAKTGDWVEVVGFSGVGMIKPRLSDSILRILGAGETPARIKVTADQLLTNDYEANLVEVEATVKQTARSGDSVEIRVSANGIEFPAVYRSQAADPQMEIPEIGSRVSLTGICRIAETATNYTLLASATRFEIKLRNVSDLRVLQSPTFWTTSRLLIALTILTVVLLFAVFWIWSLRRTVTHQTRVIVSQTRSQATREERDRIARELHDTLEQHLAGTTILLDASASALDTNPQAAALHLKTARGMLRHSLDEAQRTVLNLRTRELECGNLADAMEGSLRASFDRSRTQLVVQVKGALPPLDAVAENHLLRVAQESATNALKHADATTVRVSLHGSPSLIKLCIEDDGRGFDRESEQASAEGKFGLIGMRERAEKLGGKLRLVSVPGKGTSVELAIPLNHRLPLEPA